MICDVRYKLIYYRVGYHLQRFDLLEDPEECQGLTGEAKLKEGGLTGRLGASKTSGCSNFFLQKMS